MSSPLGLPGLPGSATQQYAVYEINRAQLSDSGIHTCVATNSAGTVEERIQLSVVDERNEIPYPGPDLPTLAASTTPDEEILFPVGSTASLRCDVGKFTAQSEIHCKRNQITLKIHLSIKQRCDKYSVGSRRRSVTGISSLKQRRINYL